MEQQRRIAERAEKDLEPVDVSLLVRLSEEEGHVVRGVEV